MFPLMERGEAAGDPGAADWFVAFARLLTGALPAPKETQRRIKHHCTVLSRHPINRLQADGLHG